MGEIRSKEIFETPPDVLDCFYPFLPQNGCMVFSSYDVVALDCSSLPHNGVDIRCKSVSRRMITFFSENSKN